MEYNTNAVESLKKLAKNLAMSEPEAKQTRRTEEGNDQYSKLMTRSSH